LPRVRFGSLIAIRLTSESVKFLKLARAGAFWGNQDKAVGQQVSPSLWAAGSFCKASICLVAAEKTHQPALLFNALPEAPKL